MNRALTAARCALLILTCCAAAGARPVHHYVFFGQDREKIRGASSFLETEALEGAQVTYSWLHRGAILLRAGDTVFQAG